MPTRSIITPPTGSSARTVCSRRCRTAIKLREARVTSSLQWGGRFSAAPDRGAARLRLVARRRSRARAVRRAMLAGARRRARRRQDRRRRDGRRRCTARSRGCRRDRRRHVRRVRAQRRRRRRPRRDRRARARARRRPARCCTPGAAATIRSRRRWRSTRAIARTRVRSGRARSRGICSRAHRRARRADAARGDDALAAGAAGAARVLARRRGRAVRRARHDALRPRADAKRFCPLGSGAVAGSTLPLDRDAAARALGLRSALAQRAGCDRDARRRARPRARLRAGVDRRVARQRRVRALGDAGLRLRALGRSRPRPARA